MHWPVDNIHLVIIDQLVWFLTITIPPFMRIHIMQLKKFYIINQLDIYSLLSCKWKDYCSIQLNSHDKNIPILN